MHDYCWLVFFQIEPAYSHFLGSHENCFLDLGLGGAGKGRREGRKGEGRGEIWGCGI